jgi:hypothetical protein
MSSSSTTEAAAAEWTGGHLLYCCTFNISLFLQPNFVSILAYEQQHHHNSGSSSKSDSQYYTATILSRASCFPFKPKKIKALNLPTLLL